MQILRSSFLLLIALIFFSPLLAQAESSGLPHEALRRLVVFPYSVEKSLIKLAEDNWWSLREQFSDSKRFLIASKNFMEVKDVFQRRGELNAGDAIILGRLLDAHVLLTVEANERVVTMRSYETKNGSLIWEKSFEMQPSVAVSKQLAEVIRKLGQAFVGAIPYQGAVMLDALTGRALYTEGQRTFVKVDTGGALLAKEGDPAQFMQIKAKNLKPLFNGGAEVTILAEGVVTKVDRFIITVEVLRQIEGAQISEGTLVRLPLEAKKNEEFTSAQPDLVERAGLQNLGDRVSALSREEAEKKPLVTALSYIGNLALVLLLAL